MRNPVTILKFLFSLLSLLMKEHIPKVRPTLIVPFFFYGTGYQVVSRPT